MILAERLEAIFLDCMFRPEELPPNDALPEGTVLVAGIVARFGLHPQRLESHRAEVAAMLDELPEPFHCKRSEDNLGGSFLDACMTKDGEQWTGEHRRVEQLFVLGIGLNIATYLFPREMWSIMPGGMPWLVVDTSRGPVAVEPGCGLVGGFG